MKTITMDEFEMAYLTLFKELITKHETIVITQQQQPIARITPYFTGQQPIVSSNNPLKDSIVFEKDIIAPIDDVWEAMT